MATKHLLAQGYQNIGLITGPLDWWEARQRQLGWQDALEEAGITIENNLVVEGDWTAESGERCLRQLLEQHPDIDAMFVCNDQMALGAMQAARQMGRRVPEDLALVGFDDIPESAYFYPPLSTVRQDMVELGRRAVRELGRTIEASQQGKAVVEPKTILLQPQLIIRESSIVTKPTDEVVEEGGTDACNTVCVLGEARRVTERLEHSLILDRVRTCSESIKPGLG